jgi:iron complex outermembrane receptor protein
MISLHGFSQTVEADTLKTFTKEANTAYAVEKIEPIIARQVNGQNLGEVLQLMSSVFIKTNGPGGIASISLRGGSAAQTQVYWDGIAINSPTLGQSDLSLLPSEFFSSVNIHPAGASSHFGFGGIAGSLNMQSNGYYSYGGILFFKKEIGSFGMDNTSARVSFGVNSRFFSETTVLRKTTDNNFDYQDYSHPSSPMTTRLNGSFEQMGFQENIQIKPKFKGRFKIIFNYLNTDRGIPVAVGVQDQNQSQTDKNFKSAIQYKTSKSVQSDGEDYRSYSHKVNVGFVHDYLNYKNQTAQINSEYFNSNYSAQFHSTYEFRKNIDLKTQLNEYLYRADSDGFDEIKFQNRFSAQAALSKEWENTYLQLNVQELMIDTKLSPIIVNLSAYQAFRIGEFEQRIFGNVGTNYRYPTLNDLYWTTGGNANLSPEESLNYEVGIKSGGSYNSRFEYSITLFQDWVDNWIQWIPNETGIWTPENVKSVQKTGVESFLQLRKRLKDSQFMIFTGSYRWVEAIINSSNVSDDEIGKSLIYTPNHVVNLDATLQLKKLSFRYNQTITSKFYLDRTNTTYLPYSAPANFKIAYVYREEGEANKNFLNLDITLHNVWGETYQIVANQPMPGRWVSFGLSYTLANSTFGKPAHY